MLNLLLSAILSAQLNAQPALQDTLVDLTGDKIEEKIIYTKSYPDSSSCVVLKYNPINSTYTKIWERRFMLNKDDDYRLFIDDYNNDNIKEFTVELPATDVFYYFIWDEKKRTFILKETQIP